MTQATTTNAALPDTVAITGSGGFLGRALTMALKREGSRVIPIVRDPNPEGNQISWSPRDGRIEKQKLEGISAVVHLAGESILGLWTPAKKERIYSSRSEGTTLLAETLASLNSPPEVLVSASAVGYYGNRGDDLLDESAPPGSDFLAETCIAWEDSTGPASAAGIRVVNARMGLILDNDGGALGLMLPVFRLGLGGRLGSGKQFMSWVHLTDAVRAILFTLRDPDLAGPINVTAPQPVRNHEFTEQLARAVGRPAFLTVPEFALKATGGMGEEMLLASQRALPTALSNRGFVFEFPTLVKGLGAALDE